MTSNNGYYSHKKREVVIFRNENFIKTFFHEFNHYLLRFHFERPPKWINEGLSEYFEYLGVEFKNITAILPTRHKLSRIKRWLNHELGNDIDWVLSISNEQWSAQNQKPDYKSSTLSYAIVFFLTSRKNSDKIIKKILQELMAGKSSKEAINLSYLGGFETFKLDFIQFYKEWN